MKHKPMTDRELNKYVLTHVLEVPIVMSSIKGHYVENDRIKKPIQRTDGSVPFNPATDKHDARLLAALYCTRYERYATIDEIDGMTFVRFASKPVTAPHDRGSVDAARLITERVLEDYLLVHTRRSTKKPFS